MQKRKCFTKNFASFLKKKLDSRLEALVGKEITAGQITDKTYVFFNIMVIQVLNPDLRCKTGF